jgi:hypothetical protein
MLEMTVIYSYRQSILSIGILWVSFLLFFNIVSPWLPAGFLWLGYALLGGCSAALLVTACMDPGIIPRCPPNALIDGMPAAVRSQAGYCPTCHIVRPSRGYHCRYCDSCIQGFDHHVRLQTTHPFAYMYRFTSCWRPPAQTAAHLRLFDPGGVKCRQLEV